MTCSLKQTVPSVIAPALRLQATGSQGSTNTMYDFRGQDLELLNKFQTRTVFTITTDKNLHVYQKETFKLAYSVRSISRHSWRVLLTLTDQQPFLMHSILSLTLMHDRYLSGTQNTKLSTTEAFHWYQATALFNSKLSDPFPAAERDAVFATAVCLGVIAFFYIDAKTPEEAWPLKSPSSLDLNWLSLSEGKKTLGRYVQPASEPSLFQTLMPLVNTKPRSTSSTVPGLEALPAAFIWLCGLDATSTPDNNAYYAVADGLAKSLHSDCKLTTILGFLCFISFLPPGFSQLLRRKDPGALLLLAYWYAKMCQYQHWWIVGRAALEGQSICMYLQRYHRHDADIQELLQYPKMMCNNVAR